MKQLLLLLSFVSTIGLAQPYNFWTSTETYTPISGGTSVNSGAVWSGFTTYSVPIGFDFTFMDSTFNSFGFEATGRIIFDTGHNYFADMFVVNGLQDKGSSSSLSPITYEVSGASGDQIFKLQVENATFAGDPSATINFQIWLYEKCSRIELHMGPNDIPDPGSAFPAGAPSSGVFYILSWGPTNYNYALMLHGNESTPQDSTFRGTTVSSSGIFLDDCPAEGTIYTFAEDECLATISEFETEVFKLFPNPTVDLLHLGDLVLFAEVKVYSFDGQLVLEFDANTDNSVIDVSELTEGTYMVAIRSGDQIIRKEFVKL